MRTVDEIDEKLRSFRSGPISLDVYRSLGQQYEELYFISTLNAIRGLLVEYMAYNEEGIINHKIEGMNNALRWLLKQT